MHRKILFCFSVYFWLLTVIFPSPGLHAVADIFCDCCKTTLGWKYEHAFESSQKYKEGKFIIELAHMIKENGWEKESWRYVTLDNKNFLLLIVVSLVSRNVTFLHCCRHLLNIHLRLLIWLLQYSTRLRRRTRGGPLIYQVKTNLTPPFFRSISSHIQFIKTFIKIVFIINSFLTKDYWWLLRTK